MNDNIEKRIYLLGPYTFNDPRYYHRLNDYNPDQQGYRELIMSLLPKQWDIKRRIAWYVVSPAVYTPRDHGFKIHVSLLSATAKDDLQKILPVLFQEEARFKILVDTKLHDFFNSQNCDKNAAGKFITVYPNSESHFKDILEALYLATQGVVGPYVLTDKPYKDSQCLYYRYGAFVGNGNRDVFDHRMPQLIGKTELVPDQRQPWFQLPPGVDDPFPENEDANISHSELLHDRYAVEEALTNHSSKGGVYLATDTRTGNRVVIKEARAWINTHGKSLADARMGLQHEEAVLKRLEATGVVPKVIDSFREWQNQFLVLEYLELPTAKDYGVWKETNTVVKAHKDPERLDFFCRRYLTLLYNLIEAVQKVHAEDIVIGDLAPQNVLYDYDSLEVRLIDFEAAYDQQTGEYCQQSFTVGFSSPVKGHPDFKHDFHALRAVAVHLIFPICRLFDFRPEARREYVQALVLDEGLPLGLPDLIEETGTDLEAAKELILEMLAKLPSLLARRQPPQHPSLHLNESIQKIRNHVHDSIQCAARGSIFPADYRIFTTNPLNVAYGAAGTCLFLHKTSGGLSGSVRDQFRTLIGAEFMEGHAPGLYVGTSGIAWACHQLGLTGEAFRLMDVTYDSPLLGDHADLFYGAAGWGLASLYFHRVTGLQRYLDKALVAADLIKLQLRESEHGLHFPDRHGNVFSGLMHGSSGIGLFYLRLHEFTQDPEHLRLAKSLLNHDLGRAREENGILQWQRNYDKPLWEPYMRIGNIGVGMVALRFFLQLKEPSYLNWAERIADSIKSQYTSQTGMFLGMSGIGTYFLDLFRATGKKTYLLEAEGFARKTLLYRVPIGDGIAFPGENLIRLTNDYGTGSAGVGLFLHRLKHKGEGSPLFLNLEPMLQTKTLRA